MSSGEKCPVRTNSRSAVQPAAWLLQRQITVRTNSNGNCSIQSVKFALEKVTKVRPKGQYRYSSTLSFTSALDGVGGHRHAPVERPGTHCAGGCMGPRASLNGRGKSRPHRDLIPDNPDRCLYTSSTCKKQLRTGNCGGLMLHILIQWTPLITITLEPAHFDNNNRLTTLNGGYKNLHHLTQFIVTTFYLYKKQQNLF